MGFNQGGKSGVSVSKGTTEGKLYHWVSTGELDGQAVVPPRKDPSRGNKDRFSGCEVILTKERMK